MSADGCGDAGKATKNPESASDEDDGMHVYMYAYMCIYACTCTIRINKAPYFGDLQKSPMKIAPEESPTHL